MRAEDVALERLYIELNVEDWVREFFKDKFEKEVADIRNLTAVDIKNVEARLPGSQIYVANAIVDKFKSRLSYVPDTKTWHIWDGRVHLPCEPGDSIPLTILDKFFWVQREALLYIKEHYAQQSALIRSSAKENSKERADKKLGEYYVVFKEHRGVRGGLSSTGFQSLVLEQLKTKLTVGANYYADDRRYFVVGNGYYDMDEVNATRQFVLKPHDPANPVWRYFKANDVPGTPYPSLQRFLNHSLADETQAHFYGKALAIPLMGAPEKTKTIVDAYGETDGGKSMINGVIKKLAPAFYYEGSYQAIVAKGKDADRHRDELRLARVVTFLEVKEKLDKTFILAYTGGDDITTDRKYRNSKTWKAQGVMFLMSNDGMNIGSQEEAVIDRIARIHFPHRFTDNAVDPRYQKDPQLGDKIAAEASGFLEWLKASYLAHLEEDLDDQPVRSISMELLKNEMQEDDNTVELYWSKNAGGTFKVEPNAPESKWVTFTEFYAKYKGWCNSGNYDLMDVSDVKSWMKREGLIKRASSQLRLIGRIESDSTYTRMNF